MLIRRYLDLDHRSWKNEYNNREAAIVEAEQAMRRLLLELNTTDGDGESMTGRADTTALSMLAARMVTKQDQRSMASVECSRLQEVATNMIAARMVSKQDQRCMASVECSRLQEVATK
eukprot:gene25626-11283_t